MARSRGVTIYGTYALVVGFINLVGNIWLAVMLTKMGASAPIGPARAWVAAVANALLCAAGIGAFLLKPWARRLAIAVAALTIVLIPLVISHKPEGDAAFKIAFFLGSIVAPFALNAGLIWFFTRPAVAAQFQSSR